MLLPKSMSKNSPFRHAGPTDLQGVGLDQAELGLDLPPHRRREPAVGRDDGLTPHGPLVRGLVGVLGVEQELVEGRPVRSLRVSQRVLEARLEPEAGLLRVHRQKAADGRCIIDDDARQAAAAPTGWLLPTTRPPAGAGHFGRCRSLGTSRPTSLGCGSRGCRSWRARCGTRAPPCGCPSVATMVFGYPGRPELAYPNGSIGLHRSADRLIGVLDLIDEDVDREGLLRDQAVEGHAEVLAELRARSWTATSRASSALAPR